MFNKKKKKEKNCNKLLALFTTATALLFGLVGVGVGLMKTQFKSALAVEYDDEEYSITLTADELNNYTFENLQNYLSTFPGNATTFGTVNYNTYENKNLDLGMYSNGFGALGFGLTCTLQQGPSTNIYFNRFVENKFTYNTIDNEFEYDLVMVLSSTYYDNFKSAIELDIQANQPNPQQPMLDFVQILIGGIVSVANGVATGVSTMAKALFLEVDTGGTIIGLSVFGGIIAIFSGLALAIAITSKVYTWITSLGN